MGLGQQSHIVSNMSLVPFKLWTPGGGGDNVLDTSKNIAISWWWWWRSWWYYLCTLVGEALQYPCYLWNSQHRWEGVTTFSLPVKLSKSCCCFVCVFGGEVTMSWVPVKLSPQMGGGDNILSTCEAFNMMLFCVCFWGEVTMVDGELTMVEGMWQWLRGGDIGWGEVTMSLVPVKLSAKGGGNWSANAGFANTWRSNKTENGSFELGSFDLTHSKVFQHSLLQLLQAIVVIVKVLSET